jgi:hypothetical protein
VHRLVCEAFHGPAPFAADACHLDGNKLNNRADNLQWASRLENARHKEAHGTTTVGEKNPAAKLTEGQVREIRASSLSQRKLAAQYGLSKALIYRIQKRQIWTHI